jgi:hypothetical protein
MSISKRQLFYILDGHTPVATDDVLEWGRMFELKNRRVKDDQIGAYWVSTVFLGVDHNYGDGPPLLFETMVFVEGKDVGTCVRYATWDEALAGHERICERLRESG